MAQDSALTKTLVFVALCTFITLAALTASLPQMLPHHSHEQGWNRMFETYSAGSPDTGSTAFMITASILGFFTAPAVAYLYGYIHGFTADFIKTIIVMFSLITTIWIVFSFSLAYGEDANGDQIMGFPETFYMFKRTTSNSAALNGADSIPNSIFAVFELGFALLTPTIVAASVQGRVNTNAFLVFIFIWHLVIYTPVAHVVWFPTGWMKAHIIQDWAGGLVVHMLAGTTALGLHIVLGKDTTPKTKPVDSKKVHKIIPAALAVWFLWFGLVSGKAHSADPAATQSIVNVIGATTSALLMSYFYDQFFEMVTTPVSLATAIVIGLVSIAPAAGYVTVGGGMCIAIAAVLITRLVGHNLLGEGKEVNEPLSVLTVHGIAGTVGFFGTAVFAYEVINPASYNGLTFGRGIPLSHHISAILALWSCGLVAVLLLAFIVNAIFPLSNAAAAPAAEYKNPAAAAPAAAVTEKEQAVELTTPSEV